MGQPHVGRTLKNAIKGGKLANGYLLAGPRGTGKTTAARILAATLNCEARSDTAEPCRKCESCQRILFGKESHDVVEIDAATNRSAEDARQLRQQALYAPTTEYGYKVYILDEAHMLTREAWNALLKILEEPPPRVLFIFCTTEPQKIEQTAKPILSRVQRLDMRRLTQEHIKNHLDFICTEEDIEIDEEAVALLARRADGGMRDALSLLDQLRAFQGETETISSEMIRDSFGIQPESVFVRLLQRIGECSRESIFDLLQYLEHEGTDFVRFMDDYQESLAALALCQEGGEPRGWSQKGLSGLKKLAGFSPGDTGSWQKTGSPLIPTTLLVELMHMAQNMIGDVRHAPHPRLVMLTLLQRSITLIEEEKE